MDVHYSLEGRTNVPRGVRGGGPALGPAAAIYRADGTLDPLPNMVGEQTVQPSERIVSYSAGGGGYGDPHHRPAQAVLNDVVEGYISTQRAREIYGIALAGDPAKVETLEIDAAATNDLRAASP